MSKINAILFVGPPAAGKGTQANLLHEALKKDGLIYIPVSSGEIIRQTGEDAESIKSKLTGSILSDDIMFELFDNYVSKLGSFDGLIIDGIPRVESQAPGFLERVNLEKVIYFQFGPDEENVLHKRMELRGRSYDKVFDQRRKRMDEFYRLTLPVLNHLPGKHVYIRGDQSLEKIHQ